MPRHIDADVLINIFNDRLEKIRNRFGDYSREAGVLAGALHLIRVQPTADVTEVKHGEWIYHLNPALGINAEDAYCSCCNYHIDTTMVDFGD